MTIRISLDHLNFLLAYSLRWRLNAPNFFNVMLCMKITGVEKRPWKPPLMIFNRLETRG